MDNDQQNQQNQENRRQDIIPIPFHLDFMANRGAPQFGNLFGPNFGNMPGNYPIRPAPMIPANPEEWYHRLVYLGMQTMTQACSLGVHILNHGPFNNMAVFPTIYPAGLAPPPPAFQPERQEAQIVELERNIVNMPSAIDMRNPPANPSNSDVSVGSMEVFPSTSSGSGSIPQTAAAHSATTETSSGCGSHQMIEEHIRRSDSPFVETSKTKSSLASKLDAKRITPTRSCRAQSLAPIIEDDDEEEQEGYNSEDSDSPPPKLRPQTLGKRGRGGRGRGRGRGKRGRRS